MKETPNEMIIHSAQQKGQNVKHDWIPLVQVDNSGLLQSAHAEIRSLKAMMEEMRQSPTAREQKGKSGKLRSKAKEKAREVVLL